MANLPAAKKAIRVTKTRTARNKRIKTRLSQLTRKTAKLIELGETKLAQQQFQTTQKALDKAAKSAVIHSSRARRIKSKLARKVNNTAKDVKTAPKNT